MTLAEAIAHWVHDAERMAAGAVERVVVTAELFQCLVREQADQAPAVAGAAVVAGVDLEEHAEMVEIAGPDRVSLDVGSTEAAAASTYPLGLDPAMPVVFVPVPPAAVDSPAQLEMYNRLRWYGLGPPEALSGCRGS